MHTRKAQQDVSRGFSLIELLVVLSIIGIITSVMLLRYGSYDSEILLSSLAYDIALGVREAQTLSISVQGSEGDFTTGYGVHFTPGNTYTLFRDQDADDRYDIGESVSDFIIGQDNRITDLCVDGSVCDRDVIDVVFRRPEPDAILYASPGSGTIDFVTITIETPTGLSRNVVVSSSGQISVE